MKANLLKICVVVLTIAILFTGCVDDSRDRYEDPPWLGGTNIQTLEKEGNYTQFLALMDKAEYRTSIERQLFTVFAPNDSSFEVYYNDPKNGNSSIDDIDKEEAVELFGQHIIANGRSRDQLIYEYQWGELQDTSTEYASLFHRKLTYGKPKDYYEQDVPYAPGFVGTDVRVYRSETWVPLFTSEYFNDNFGDAEFDYEFMFPGSVWGGTQWGEGNVVEIARTSSGFIYFLDRVVKPMPTINKYLYDNQEDFGVFYDIAQRFAVYKNKLTTPDKSENIYKKSYTDIVDIAEEQGSNISQVPTRLLYMYTAFVPYNNVLEAYLQKTIYANGYTPETLDSVPKLFFVFLLQSQINDGLGLPSKIDERYVNFYGDAIDINLEADINKSKSKMCSNGIVYPTNKFFEPNVFTCVPGPIFYSSDYSTFLYALNQAGAINSLSDPKKDVTLFAPTNDELFAYGIRANEDANNNIVIEINTPTGWIQMNSDELYKFVGDYYRYGRYDDNFAGEGYFRMSSNNYIYYNDGKIYGGGNLISNEPNTVTDKKPSDQNGTMFYLDKTLQRSLNAAQLILTDPDLALFDTLLVHAGLISAKQNPNNPDDKNDKIPFVNFMTPTASDQWTVLAPSNQAIIDAQLAGLIPPIEEKDSLQNFLKYHFIQNIAVFDDGQFNGSVATQRIESASGSGIVYETLTFTNMVHALSVQDKSGKVIAIDHSDADRLIETGVLHKINTILTIE